MPSSNSLTTTYESGRRAGRGRHRKTTGRRRPEAERVSPKAPKLCALKRQDETKPLFELLELLRRQPSDFSRQKRLADGGEGSPPNLPPPNYHSSRDIEWS